MHDLCGLDSAIENGHHHETLMIPLLAWIDRLEGIPWLLQSRPKRILSND